MKLGYGMFGFALLFLVACSESELRQRPSDIIDPDTMARMIAEHHILNARSQDREVRKKRLTDFVKIDQQALYDSLHISEDRFEESMDYYLGDYKEMQKLHVKAMEILSTRMAELKAAGADSLVVDPIISEKKLGSLDN
ncbi:MAG: hypothetical protein Salg2KO_08010 [Salibacteraceae bacterium]